MAALTRPLCCSPERAESEGWTVGAKEDLLGLSVLTEPPWGVPAQKSPHRVYAGRAQGNPKGKDRGARGRLLGRAVSFLGTTMSPLSEALLGHTSPDTSAKWAWSQTPSTQGTRQGAQMQPVSGPARHCPRLPPLRLSTRRSGSHLLRLMPLPETPSLIAFPTRSLVLRTHYLIPNSAKHSAEAQLTFRQSTVSC